jgi:hypothetical protein
MTEQVNINIKLQRRLSVGLAAATLVLALLFFASSVLLNDSWYAAIVVQTGLRLESFVAIFAVSAIVLSTGSFIISCKQRSVLAAGLLAASGVIFMIHPLSIFMMHFMKHTQMAIGHSAAIPGGPILVVILGLGILGLGVVKGIKTGRTEVAAAR